VCVWECACLEGGGPGGGRFEDMLYIVGQNRRGAPEGVGGIYLHIGGKSIHRGVRVQRLQLPWCQNCHPKPVRDPAANTSHHCSSTLMANGIKFHEGVPALLDHIIRVHCRAPSLVGISHAPPLSSPIASSPRFSRKHVQQEDQESLWNPCFGLCRPVPTHNWVQGGPLNYSSQVRLLSLRQQAYQPHILSKEQYSAHSDSQ